MAKKKQTTEQSDEFFEALPQAENFEAPFDLDQLGESLVESYLAAKHYTQKAAKIAKSVASETLPFARAAAVDTAHYSQVIARAATSKKAAKIYKITAILATGAATLAFAFLASTTYALYANDLANPTALLAKKNTGTTILDRNGAVLYRVYGADNHSQIHLQDMPQSLIQATLTAEDPDFYNHDGVSLRATARAMFTDLTQHGKLQGGSTITQQLVKNALLSADKSFTRKGQEIILATELERRYSKDQILEMYLNKIYYGQGSNGIESASQTYFHKPAKDLTLSESALLAGLPLCPGSCDPNLDIDKATARRNYILQRMQELGKITPEQAQAAEAEPVQASAQQIEIHAPHFVFYVLDELRQTYGEDLVEHGGITVYTTLDLTKQQEAERIIAAQVQHLQYNHVTNGALISTNPTTGEIISMVGSADYYNPQFGSVNVTLSLRQPGSSFKPFAYLTAFKKGWSGATTVDDKPVSFLAGDGTIYKPQDYDGKYRGSNITLRRALTNSLNIPAIHVLEHAGIHDTIQTAHDLGITSLNDESRYGLSLVLGGGEVRMIDMATAYGAMDNGGIKVLPKSIIKVQDRYGSDITKKSDDKPQQVLDPRLAYMITNIMSDNNARAEIFGANSPLKLSKQPAAAKTGTTNDFRDNWTAGYTPDVVTVVWMGNNDNSPMQGVDGITGAAPAWHNYMEYVLRGLPVKQFNRPNGLVTAKVCSRDGGLLNPWDTGYDEFFLPEAQQTKHCSSEAPKPPEPPKDDSKPDPNAPVVPILPPQPIQPSPPDHKPKT